jgi:hypothetical protein
MIELDREKRRSVPALHFGLVSLWLVLGFALIGTALAVFEWRTVTQIWFASGVGLALLVLPDIVRSHREPIALPEPGSN